MLTGSAQMALFHRPTDFGIDLPPGRGSDELVSADYRPVEMTDPSEKFQFATIHRPAECGIDLPAGSSSSDLQATDYRIIEME